MFFLGMEVSSLTYPFVPEVATSYRLSSHLRSIGRMFHGSLVEDNIEIHQGDGTLWNGVVWSLWLLMAGFAQSVTNFFV